MICRLCGLDKKLIEAHVVPKSFFRIEPTDEGPLRLVTNVEGQFAQKLPKGPYDSAIICESCERRFSRWDDYGDHLFIKSWDSFERIPLPNGDFAFGLPTYEYPTLKLFILSVLWRISVSTHRMFSGIALGPLEETLRMAIWNAEPGDANFFGVVLQAFDTTDVGILNPGSERFGHLRFCRIYLSHVIAFIKVDSRSFDDPFLSLALRPNSPLVLASKKFATSPEKRIMTKLVVGDRSTKHRE